MSDDLPQPNSSPGQAHQPASPDAQMDIPAGTVSRLRALFEQQIAEHQYEPDEVYVRRTVEAAVMLTRQSTSYAQQLRNVEQKTLMGLDEDLILFLRNHDNFYRAALRSRKRAQDARNGGTDMDVLTGVSHRIVDLRYLFVMCFVREESSLRANIARMRQAPEPKQEFNEVATILKRQLTTALTRLDTVARELDRDVELENVGPDHNVNDFGQAVPSHRMRLRGKEEIAGTNDHSTSCCICLDAYNGSKHTAFRLNVCNHIVGKQCMAAWLNGTSTNSTLCPHCRALICTRRPRRPVDSVGRQEIEEESSRVTTLIQRTMILIEEADIVHFDVYGASEKEFHEVVTREGGFMSTLMGEANETLAANGMSFAFVAGDRGWRLQWAELDVDVTEV